MAGRSWVILMDAEAWRVWTVEGGCAEQHECLTPSEDDSDVDPASLIEALRRLGYAGEPVALLLSSATCLCAGIDVDDLPRRQARAAMTYRFEEKLPVAAEDVVADFVTTSEAAMGVCIVTDTLRGVIEALQAADIAVELIAPGALLALQATAGDETADAMVLVDEGRIELFVMEQGRPTRWHTMAADGDDLAMHLNMYRPAEDDATWRVALCGADTAPAARRVGMVDRCEIIEADAAPIEIATAHAAARAMTGKLTAWINLCEGPLAAANPIGQLRTPAKLAVAAALVLWVCCMGAMAWRAQAYKTMTAADEARQAAIYRELFDGRQAPLNVKSRLISERRSLVGVRRGDRSPLPRAESVLPMLHDTLQALPRDLRFTIQQLTLDENDLTIDGLVAAHSSADALATTIGRGTGWRIQPPRTQLLSDNEVSFTLRGSPETSTPAPRADARASR